MQKKPGQISANTLGLRFMQNAARARQEREVEEAKAKVRTEEEWELAPELRESWEDGQEDDQKVSYEPSYLPFLFPGLSSSTIPVTSTTAEPDDPLENGESGDEAPAIKCRGRRKFGKHGKETVEDTPRPASPPPPLPEVDLPRGFRSISSHGRAAAAAAKTKVSRRPPQRATTPPPPLNPNLYVPPPPKPQGFMKPPVDAPRDTGARRKRPAEGGASGLSNGNRTDEVDTGKRRKKRGNE